MLMQPFNLGASLVQYFSVYVRLLLLYLPFPCSMASCIIRLPPILCGFSITSCLSFPFFTLGCSRPAPIQLSVRLLFSTFGFLFLRCVFSVSFPFSALGFRFTPLAFLHA